VSDTIEDATFFKNFALVVGALVALAVIFGIIAGLVSRDYNPGQEELRSELARQAVLDRLAPLASVEVAGAAGSQSAAAPLTGEEVVAQACAACHNAGVAEAPLTGDTVAWRVRYDLGMDLLMASVINGKGAMPARAGYPNLTDDEIYAGIVELMALAKIEVVDARPAATPTAAEESVSATDATESVVEETGADAVAETVADVPAVVVEVTADAAPVADNAAILALGEQVYNRGCQNCHGMGIAGAPRLGDKDAWTARIAQGNELIFQHSLRGFAGSSGFMPPKGGMPFLSDEDVIAASLYMIEMGK